MVDADFRCRGIGSALLKRADNFLIGTGKEVDLLDFEHEFFAVAELLELARRGHFPDFVLSFSQFRSDLLKRIEHLGHGIDPPRSGRGLKPT